MKALNHPNIVKVAGHWLCPATPSSQKRSSCMVMELMNCGSLKDWAKELDSRGQGYLLDERLLRSLMKQSLSALRFLHLPIHTDPFGRENMSIVHHDVKPHNMLLHERDDGELILKLADFGLAHFDRLHHLTQHVSMAGTRSYLSPESTRHEQEVDQKPLQYTPASDIYSWALSFVKIGAMCGLHVTPHAMTLLTKCANPSPEERPSALDLLADEYFASDALFETWLDETTSAQQHPGTGARTNATPEDSPVKRFGSFSSNMSCRQTTTLASCSSTNRQASSVTGTTTTTSSCERYGSFSSNLSLLLPADSSEY